MVPLAWHPHCKHEELSLIPRAHMKKLDVVAKLVTTGPGKVEIRSWDLVRSQSNSIGVTPCQKEKGTWPF